MTKTTYGKLLMSLIATLALVSTLALAACSGGDAAGGDAGGAAGKITVSLTIDGTEADRGIIYQDNITIDEGQSVYDALLASGVDMVAGSSLGMGAYVSSIEGLSEKDPQPTSGWIYSVNGEVASTSCDAYSLADGDVVEWVWHIDALGVQ